MIYDYSQGSGVNITVSADAAGATPESFSVSAGQTDVTLKYTMPQAEYMYGCAATAIGMLIGYYDLYGCSAGTVRYDMGNLIAGTISVNSRGSDGGSIYDMKDPSVLANFIASTGYVSRFYEQTPEHEKPYSFVDGDPAEGLNVSVWDCLADYLGTGQYWRSNEDLGTSHYNDRTLEDIIDADFSATVDGEGIPAQFVDFKYGLSIYIQSVGYALDVKETRSISVGNFTFEDFCSEIDADRPVLVSMNSGAGGHMVVAYGYNKATQEIIFDDTYEADCRMTWTGTYKYAGGTYSLTSFTTVVFDESSLTSPDAPAVLAVNADTTELTNQSVTLTAEFNDEVATPQYSFDGEVWNLYEDYVEMADNGKVYFRGVDKHGNVSAVVIYNVENIDRLMPEVEADITEPTNRNVTVTAFFNSGVATKQYSTDGKTWKTYTKAIEVDRNQTLYFRGLDKEGNASNVVTYDVTNIDKTAPDTPKVTASTTAPTNQNVTLTATYSGDSEKKQYSFDGETWKDYTGPLSIDRNRGVYFRAVDAVGNVSQTSYLVSNIDKVAPDDPEIKVSTDKPTNRDVTVTAVFTDDSKVKEYSFDGETWENYSEAITVSENTLIYFRAGDELGNMSLPVICAVTNIDKVAPTVTVKADTTDPTNQDVTLTATVSKDAVSTEYSFDGRSWKSYSKSVKVEKNGTVSFRAADAAGNLSDIVSYKVANIDRTAPTVTVKASTTKPTNQDVTLTATVSKDAVATEYSFDKKTWKEYDKAVKVGKNGTVYFRAADAAGNVSKIVSYEVANIDKTAPDAPKAAADVTNPTNKNVVVTATFGKDSAEKQYSFDGETWNAYTKALTIKENCTVSFRGIDAAGNVSKVTNFKVANIDRTAPDAPTVKANTTRPARSVKLTATFSDDTVYGGYSGNNKDWQFYTGTVTVTANGTYYFRGVDAAGNFSATESIKVSNIDKNAPLDAPAVKASTTKPTNQTVTLTATFGYGSAQKQYSTDKKSWKTYSKAITVKANGTYYFRGVDAAGIVSKVTSIKVANIDKAAPDAPKVKASTTKPTNQDVTLTATFTGDSAKKQYSTDKKTWKTYSKAITVKSNATYYFRGADAAGNVSKVTTVKVANIDRKAPDAPTVKLSTVKATEKSVTVTAKFSSDSKTRQYSTDKKTWKNYSKSLTAKANGTYYFRGIDEAGNVSKVTTAKVSNIVDSSNNSWADATALTGTVLGALEPKADQVDYYDVGDVAKLMLDMESSKAKVTFCGSDKKAVKTKVTLADGSSKTLSGLTLASGDKTTDKITLSDLGDAVKYLRIECAASDLASYKLAKLA